MLRILLVDDDPEEYELITSALKTLKVNAEIIQTPHCVELTDNIRKIMPDLVFLDINMPFKNGIDCLKSLRADKKFESLPVIMYSTSNNNVDIEESYKHSANLYVVKPDNFQKLVKSLEEVLSFDWGSDSKVKSDKFLIA
jgi:DNA-binding response OmpR family regulator